MSKIEEIKKEVVKIFNNNWNKQVILYGPPGTSKTYLAQKIAKEFLEVKDLNTCPNYKLVQFHPSYSYEDFVRGITAKTENGNIEYKTVSKIFEEFCSNNSGKKVLIIDEINRAPLASVLGELIYGLEYRGQPITTPYQLDENKNKPLIVPEDLYIIGTMNTADRSIGSIDYAVRRRFAFVQVRSSDDKIKESWKDEKLGEKAFKLYDELINSEEGIEKGIFAKDKLADNEIDVEDIKIGHTYFLGLKEKIDDNNNEKFVESEDYLEYKMKYQVRPIYMEYIKDGIISPGSEKDFDKIVRKYLPSWPYDVTISK